MASFTPAYAANILVRSFLIRAGTHYLSEQSPDEDFYEKALHCLKRKPRQIPSFDVKGKAGGAIWEYVKRDVFEGKCAYCGKETVELTVEHLEMMNKDQVGLHHPGNVVPVCPPCNQRRRHGSGEKKYFTWQEQLECVADCKKDVDCRKKRIDDHIEEANYPLLNDSKRKRIKCVAEKLSNGVSEAACGANVELGNILVS